MSLGDNIVFLRKKQNLTQEELAEKLSVSRQSISKWESDNSFPEMDKLVQICDLFQCDMDSLLRGSVEKTYDENGEEYDKHMNLFTKEIMIGVDLILWGVVALIYMNGIGFQDTIASVIFMLFVIIAVVIFVISGIHHETFGKKHKEIKDFYTEEQRDAFDQKFPILMAVPIAMILFGVVLIMASESLPAPMASQEQFYTAIFMMLVAIAVPFFIYGGMQKDKYDIEKYNYQQTDKPEIVVKREKVGKYSSVIMLTATAIYLLTGFALELWGVTWFVFPIGGIMCGIVSTIIGNK